MGFLDKVKNIFTEEVEDDDVKVEQIQKEVTHVSIESPAVNRKSRHDSFFDRELNPVNEKDDSLKEIEEVEEKNKKPVLFDESAFADLSKPAEKTFDVKSESRIETRNNYKSTYDTDTYVSKPYGGKTVIASEKKNFKPTPIISPVYGILDRNYHKEDIIDKKDRIIKTADGLSVDSIRNKAYGNTESDLDDTIFKNSILFNDNDSDDNLKDLDENDSVNNQDADLFTELSQENGDEITSEETEKNIRELEEITMDLTKELDNLLSKKDAMNRESEQIDNGNDNLNEKDLFNLIDSMYEEGEEDK